MLCGSVESYHQLHVVHGTLRQEAFQIVLFLEGLCPHVKVMHTQQEAVDHRLRVETEQPPPCLWQFDGPVVG